MTWKDVVGQPLIIKNLQGALAHDKISHAYLIQGEKLSGKRLIAEIFARALQCECGREDQEEARQATLSDLGAGSPGPDAAGRTRPCGQCRSCRQALNGNHPDIIYVEHEKPNVISVDNIRYQVNSDIGIKPYSSAYKVYIIDEAEKMNIQAQNALLKTLEEPPGYAVIMLLASRGEAMLQTIMSRCVVLDTKPVPDDMIREHLMRKVQVPDYRASLCASFARGNVGRAMELASNEAFDHMRRSVLGVMENIHDLEISQAAVEIKKITEEKFDTSDYLDLCFIWFRDVLLYKACGPDGDRCPVIFREELQDIAAAARRYSYERIEKIIHSIDRARSRLAANVNFDLTMELMMMDMMGD